MSVHVVASYSTFSKSGRAIADGVSEVNFQAESLSLVIIIFTGQLMNCLKEKTQAQ